MMGKGVGLSHWESQIWIWALRPTWWVFEVVFHEKITLCNQIRLYWNVKPCSLNCFVWVTLSELGCCRVAVLSSCPTLPKPCDRWVLPVCVAHTWNLRSPYLIRLWLEYFIPWPPRCRQDNSVARLTEMRIRENNVASPKILLIQGQQQEATVESAEYRVPDKPRSSWLRAGALWAHRYSQGVQPPVCRSGLGFWTLHACRLDGGLFVSISLAGVEAASSQGLVWPPLLPGKGSSQLPTQLPLFLTSPLMWQLSAYHSAWCQGNHWSGVGREHSPHTAKALSAGMPCVLMPGPSCR